jgi:hypothetical protein
VTAFLRAGGNIGMQVVGGEGVPICPDSGPKGVAMERERERERERGWVVEARSEGRRGVGGGVSADVSPLRGSR